MQRNIFLFIVLAALVLSGWFWLVIYNRTPKDEDAIAKAESDAKKEKDARVKAAQAKAVKDKEDKDNEAKAKEKKEPDKKPPVEKIAKEVPAKTETLGGAGFHLTVDTTTRGAGVRRVVLNRFESADWRGRPKLDEAGDPVPLELIQDNEYTPAFRMYHYPEPQAEHPVFGLGEKIWQFEGRNKADEQIHEVRYSSMVPGLEDQVKIVKTYRLGPQDYHVTLLLEIHDLRTDRHAPKIPFRYQLTGGQGLPIEGEWYTAIFRNAIMGLVEGRDSLWRKLEDSTRVSMRKGGDRFPAGERGDNRLQYAGVANQYFGVMIVVDNEQPKDGGTKAEKILAWARPTLETTEKKGVITKTFKDKDTILFSDESRATLEYSLLPRTKRHLADLKLEQGDKAVLSVYETPDGKRIATWVRLGETHKPQFDDITVRVSSEVVELQSRDVYKHQFMLYHGPVKAALLAQFTGDKAVPPELVERYTHTLHLRTLTDYHSDNWFGRASSFIHLTDLIILFTRLMHWLLNFLHFDFIGYGPTIIVLTVMVRGAMFPISRRQAMFSIKMQALAPELKKIQEKYPDDAQARWQATQEFNRKNGINPLGSCWPVFLQMPIFLGLYFALQESIHFRLADFLWIKNLAAPDMLIYWSESIPIISVPDQASGILGALYLGPYFNILPCIAVVFMMIQQMQTMPPPTDEQQAMQQKMLKYMSILFGIMFYKVAAGLCIYFISSSLWGLAERKLLPKKKPLVPVPEASSTAITNLAPESKWKGKNSRKDKANLKEKEKDKDKEAITTFDKLKALWKEILKQAEKK
jgi:YidC/Oxa1 family membrane protein insertase